MRSFSRICIQITPRGLLILQLRWHFNSAGPKIDVVSSANALQVDGQNDNGWDQGLVFMNQSQVWGQPPYYVDQMKARSWQPNLVRADVAGGDALFDVTALIESGMTITQLIEHDTVPWNPMPGKFRKVEGDEWQLADRPSRLPHTYTLQAVV